MVWVGRRWGLHERAATIRSRGFRVLLAALPLLLLGCENVVDTDSQPADEAWEEVQASGVLGPLNAELRTLMAAQAPNGSGGFYRLPDSDRLRRIPQDPKNPLTEEKVRLGKLLFHETALAVGNLQENTQETYSCASCHFAQAGFQANLPQGIAEGGTG